MLNVWWEAAKHYSMWEDAKRMVAKQT